MNILKYIIALSFSALALPQAFACFTVYNTGNQPVYSNMEPPINMSYQIHERLPAVFPGGHMIFGNSTDCPNIDTRKTSVVFSNVNIATAAPAVRARRMSVAQRNREQDALTK